MTHRFWAALAGVALGLATGHASTGPTAAGPAALTVYAASGTPITLLHLQPGFATVLRADRRIDTVAIGDPRLVSATTVLRGQEVYDLILQAQADAGATNMVVWFGDLTTIWDLEIGPGHRTADLINVVTAASAPHPGASPPAAAPPPALSPVPATVSGARGARPERRSGRSGPPLLEVRQAVQDITGLFQVVRTPDEVVIRYRISNDGPVDLTIRPGGVLVRVNGQIVSYGMVRDAVDHQRPDILPRGATETGVIDAPSRSPRRVQVVFSLVPAGVPGRGARLALPITFQPAFANVDLMDISSTP
jgi:putative type II/III system pilus formation protein